MTALLGFGAIQQSYNFRTILDLSAAAVNDQELEPGKSAWQWMVFGPYMFVGAVFGFQYWRMSSGAAAFFGMNRDSHGSARFANSKELKKLERADGLLIGRNPHTGRLLRYDVQPI
jgi:hypothetical protein